MALARHKSRGVRAASVLLVCDVCRERPATTLVVDFIFACNSCAKRIVTTLWYCRQERVVAGKSSSSDRETNQWVH